MKGRVLLETFVEINVMLANVKTVYTFRRRDLIYMNAILIR